MTTRSALAFHTPPPPPPPCGSSTQGPIPFCALLYSYPHIHHQTYSSSSSPHILHIHIFTIERVQLLVAARHIIHICMSVNVSAQRLVSSPPLSGAALTRWCLVRSSGKTFWFRSAVCAITPSAPPQLSPTRTFWQPGSLQQHLQQHNASTRSPGGGGGGGGQAAGSISFLGPVGICIG